MTMLTNDLSHASLPRLPEVLGLADVQVRTGQHDRLPSDPNLANAERDEIASLVVALVALLGITLTVIVLGAPKAPPVTPAAVLRPAPAGLALPAATTAAPHGVPARLSLHGR